MRILVTGGAGFIGSHVADGFRAAGHEVAIVDDLSTGNPANLDPAIKLYQCDIRDASLETVFKDFRPEIVDYLIEKHYRPVSRPLRRCQPRDLLSQVRNFCVYNGLPVEMRPEHFDRAVHSYFTMVKS